MKASGSSKWLPAKSHSWKTQDPNPNQTIFQRSIPATILARIPWVDPPPEPTRLLFGRSTQQRHTFPHVPTRDCWKIYGKSLSYWKKLLDSDWLGSLIRRWKSSRKKTVKNHVLKVRIEAIHINTVVKTMSLSWVSTQCQKPPGSIPLKPWFPWGPAIKGCENNPVVLGCIRASFNI